MAEIFGKETGYSKGKGGSMHISDKTQGIIGTSGIVGAGIPLAVGAGLSAKLRGTSQVSISFFGDGASNTGAFHEGLNLAGAWRLPVVFVCENNLYGVSLPVSKSTAVKNLAERAHGYGFPGVIVDGMDVAAVYQVAEKAVKRAREGRGPTLIECKTYRYRGHYEGDAWHEIYRTRKEIETWRKRDAIVQHRKRLINKGIISEEEASQIEKEIADEVEQAVRFAMESQSPPVSEALTDVYA
jgi:TPP-dependent pyruvate/acetoin dehydrogenase alpha subunit